MFAPKTRGPLVALPDEPMSPIPMSVRLPLKLLASRVPGLPDRRPESRTSVPLLPGAMYVVGMSGFVVHRLRHELAAVQLVHHVAGGACTVEDVHPRV